MDEVVQSFISQLMREGANRYLVLTMRTPNFDASVVGQHYSFLKDLREKGLLEMAGPFADQSGGAYVLLVESLERAMEIAHADPLYVSGSSVMTVRAWAVM